MKIKTYFNILLLATVTLMPVSGLAQGLKIITKDGKTTLIPYENLDRVTTYEEEADSQLVDLGLSVKWASCNIGASTPEEAGSYFMWAGVVDDPDCKYNKLTCPYQDPDFAADPDNFIDYFLKYCNTNDAGIPDYIFTLEPMDDAATVNLGEDWRMPTAEEMTELIENCDVEYYDADNDVYHVAGYEFTGPSGNSIFLPMAGYRYLLNIYYEGTEINYWTSSLYAPSCLFANALTLKGYGANKYLAVDFKGRYMGFPIRPVSNK